MTTSTRTRKGLSTQPSIPSEREPWASIEFRQTLKHGRWLNIAENKLRSLTRQCVDGRRFGDVETLREATAAWSCDVNSTLRGDDWQMRIDEAPCKLITVYTKIKH